MVPVVAIIGRPNVGKSALFNRLIKKRQALVDATPGLTRDRLYGDVTWRGLPFRIVDTGGLEFSRGSRLGQAIASQVSRAMEEASLALLVCDARQGLLPLDSQVAFWARRWGKPLLLIANKVDDPKQIPSIFEFTSLGIGSPHPVSSIHGTGSGDLLDAVVEQLRISGCLEPDDRSVKPSARPLKVAIVGRPNVGKSSFLNRILNEERVLVDEKPGTTRDPIEVNFTYKDQAYCLVDTAGMRSPRHLKQKIDAVARLKALEVVRESDVCLGILEGSFGIVLDDLKLLDEVMTVGKPLCLAVNKWDLVKGAPDARQAASKIVQRAPFLRFAPVICTSAKTGLNVLKALEQAAELALRANRRVSGSEARQLLDVIRTDPRTPVAVRNAHLIRLAQVGVSPPTFHLMARISGGYKGKTRGFQLSDMAYLEGVIRRELKLEGVPVRIHLLAMKNNRRDSKA